MGRTRFLFWNTYGNPDAAALVASSDADVVMFAELPDGVDARLSGYVPVSSVVARQRTRVFFRRESCRIDERFVPAHRRWAFHRLVGPTRRSVNLGVVHLQSKLQASEASRDADARRLAEDLAEFEGREARPDSVLVGDFNVNPFEPSMVDHHGLNAILCARTAAEGGGRRTLDGEDRRTLYNPMWSVLGDRSVGPAGSHFYAASERIRTFWHVYDQVLVRPALADRLHEVRLLSELGGVSLITSGGRPDKQISDHLPLAFDLDLTDD